jgi:hypothetical protein
MEWRHSIACRFDQEELAKAVDSYIFLPGNGGQLQLES